MVILMHRITSYRYINNYKDKTILFLHGWGCNYKYFTNIANKIDNANCLLIDLLNFMLSYYAIKKTGSRFSTTALNIGFRYGINLFQLRIQDNYQYENSLKEYTQLQMRLARHRLPALYMCR